MANNQSHVADYKYKKGRNVQTPAINQSLLTESDQVSCLQEQSSLQGAHLVDKLVMVAGTKRKWKYQDLAVATL